jgi:hypothetical protein
LLALLLVSPIESNETFMPHARYPSLLDKVVFITGYRAAIKIPHSL